MKSMNRISSRIEILNINQLRNILGGDGVPTSNDEQDLDIPDIQSCR